MGKVNAHVHVKLKEITYRSRSGYIVGGCAEINYVPEV